MKTRNFIKMAVLSAGVFFASCNRNERTENLMSKEEAQSSSKIDLASDDVNSIVEDQYDNIESSTFSNKNGEVALSTCATITRVPSFGTPLTPGTQVTKTIDFGTGCTLSNGNVVSGKIIITFVYQPTATSHTINYSFVNFYHNSIKIEGDKTFTGNVTNCERCLI